MITILFFYNIMYYVNKNAMRKTTYCIILSKNSASLNISLNMFIYCTIYFFYAKIHFFHNWVTNISKGVEQNKKRKYFQGHLASRPFCANRTKTGRLIIYRKNKME